MEHSPKPHAGVDVIKAKARAGVAFFVNNAALNGDLAQLSESEQRRIIAMANDYAAAYANEQIIPRNDQTQAQNQEFIERHLDIAARIFMKEGGKDVQTQLHELLEPKRRR